MSKNRIIIIAAVAGALVVAVTLLLLLGESDRDSGSQGFDLEERLYEEASKRGLEGSGGNFGEVLARTAETQETLLRDTQRFFRYPARSRPLTRRMKDLINPFYMIDGPHPIFDKEKPEPGTPPVYNYQFDTPRRSIVGKQRFLARLQVWTEPVKSRVAPKIIEAAVHSDIQTGRVKISDATFNDSGKEGDKEAGDNIVTFRWAPPHTGRIAWGELSLRVKFQTPEGKVITHSVDFHSTPKLAAKFTGDFTEELRDGSLVIRPQIEVYQRGVYMFDANLYQEDGNEPTHWVRSWAQLEPGTHRIDLLFFGKVFHDKQADGRFVLRQLRGYRQNEIDFDINQKISPAELDQITAKTTARNEPRNQYLPLVTEFRTKSYSLSSFSQDEYDGPDKTRRLELIRAGKFQ